ncbi:unnamed protein product [Paramecium sonneborni]|uniref:FCP1 homology domain-containing protein n=1 Tax=Paramecium sonneborni TaxID=65129 RepID=A0A8S1KHH5_9CILI|nr:unnamed protein product [Paramecium sonneborni]
MKQNIQRFIPSQIGKARMPQQQLQKQEEFSKKFNRGQSAENKISNKAQNDIKSNTPEINKIQNNNYSPIVKQADIQKPQKQKNMIQQISKVPITSRLQKNQSIVNELDQQKNRSHSQFKFTREITPTKKQPIIQQQQLQRASLKNQTIINQQKLPQEKLKNSVKHVEANKIEQRGKIQQNEKLKEEQKIIQKQPQKKLNQKKEQNPKLQNEKQPQHEKPPQIQSPRQISSRQSFSPQNQIGKTPNMTRGHSPSNFQNDTLNGKLQALLTVVRPIFKEAKYYLTSVIHFLREQYYPNTSPYQVQFKIEFQDQKDYFKNKFCDHFNVTYNSLKHCSQLNLKKQFNTKFLNPPKKPNFSSDNIKTLIFDLDETLIHTVEINNPTDYKVIIHIPNEQESEVRFNIRPHCQQMLKVLSEFYELILFTASYREYADKILEYIDPKSNLFSYRFYRESCLEIEEEFLIKDLRVIEGRKLENMAIIDNNAYSYYFQLDNGIPIIPFEENKQDKELIFMTDYLIKCEKQKNWLQYHQLHFQNQLYLKCSTIEECIEKLLQTQNQ